MRIYPIETKDIEDVAPLVAAFRVTLRTYKGIESDPDLASAKEELLDFINRGYPIFAAEDRGKPVGYIVCRTGDGLLWAEHLYVCEQYRRQGVASMLFAKAEEISAAMGQDTVFNYVHPNNDGMIAFLRSKGYIVLNLIEIRKPYAGEKTKSVIRVENNTFDY